MLVLTHNLATLCYSVAKAMNTRLWVGLGETSGRITHDEKKKAVGNSGMLSQTSFKRGTLLGRC